MGAGNSASKDQKKAAELAFKAYDADKNKKLGVAELTKLFQDHGINVSPKEYELAFYLVDDSGNGKVEFKEFLPIFQFMQKNNFQVNFWDLVAAAADNNGDGKLDQKELKAVYKYCKKEMPKEVVESAKKQKMTKAEFIEHVKTLM